MKSIESRIVLMALVAATFASPLAAQRADIPSAVVLGNRGDIYVAGTSVGASGHMDLLLLAYDSNGTIRATRRISTIDPGAVICSGLALQDHAVVLGGTRTGSGTGPDMVAARFGIDDLVSVVSTEQISSSTALIGIYPNPIPGAVGTGTVRYSVRNEEHVRIRIIDALGREITVLVDAIQSPGLHDAVFSLSGMTEGIYFCRMETQSGFSVRKLTLIR